MSNRSVVIPPISDKVSDERVPPWAMPEYSQISSWLEGAGMSIDEAVAFALGDEDPAKVRDRA